jgi:DnaJ-class molecular chaperone
MEDKLMVDRESTCKACEGTGMLSDDEGWQYTCSVCRGEGSFDGENASKPAKLMAVDENNRLMD